MYRKECIGVHSFELIEIVQCPGVHGFAYPYQKIKHAHPHVEAEHRDHRVTARDDAAAHERVVLVRRRRDAERAVRLDAEPRPPRAEAPRGGGVELGLHLVERAEGGVDRGLEVGRGAVGVGRRAHDGPEERVVPFD